MNLYKIDDSYINLDNVMYFRISGTGVYSIVAVFNERVEKTIAMGFPTKNQARDWLRDFVKARQGVVYDSQRNVS